MEAETATYFGDKMETLLNLESRATKPFLSKGFRSFAACTTLSNDLKSKRLTHVHPYSF